MSLWGLWKLQHELFSCQEICFTWFASFDSDAAEHWTAKRCSDRQRNQPMAVAQVWVLTNERRASWKRGRVIDVPPLGFWLAFFVWYFLSVCLILSIFLWTAGYVKTSSKPLNYFIGDFNEMLKTWLIFVSELLTVDWLNCSFVQYFTDLFVMPHYAFFLQHCIFYDNS